MKPVSEKNPDKYSLRSINQGPGKYFIDTYSPSPQFERGVAEDAGGQVAAEAAVPHDSDSPLGTHLASAAVVTCQKSAAEK